MEIERKYLLRKLPEQALAAPRETIEQGYLPGTAIVERLRKVVSASGVRYVRTVKLGRGLVRTEVEEPIAAELFERLWPLTEGQRLSKVRYRVQSDGYVWEVDAFTDRPLVLAEVELTSADEVVTLPAWLAAVAEREVTDDDAFVNVNLAR